MLIYQKLRIPRGFTTITTYHAYYVEENTGETEYQLVDRLNRDREYIQDVTFITKAQLPKNVEIHGIRTLSNHLHN